jgi:hypothetical protein
MLSSTLLGPTQVWPCQAVLHVLHSATRPVQDGGGENVVVKGPRTVRGSFVSVPAILAWRSQNTMIKATGVARRYLRKDGSL